MYRHRPHRTGHYPETGTGDPAPGAALAPRRGTLLPTLHRDGHRDLSPLLTPRPDPVRPHRLNPALRYRLLSPLPALRSGIRTPLIPTLKPPFWSQDLSPLLSPTLDRDPLSWRRPLFSYRYS